MTSQAMPQANIDTRAIELAQIAKSAVEMHLISDTLIHAEIQNGMADMKVSLKELGEAVADGLSKVHRRIDWLMICILAGVGTAALAVFVAMFPWRAL